MFVVEGDKMVLDLSKSSFETVTIFADPHWLKKNSSRLTNLKQDQLLKVTEKELKKISFLKTPHHVLALAKLPDLTKAPRLESNNLILALDSIQDPGNVGTIIRTAAWFGIQTLICSPNTADAFNPKVIQASMSALFQVKIYYAELKKVLSICNESDLPVYGAFPDGTSVYQTELKPGGVLLMGNESKGISPELFPLISHHISIPRINIAAPVDSLNVSMATSILCAEFSRRQERNHSK